MPQPDKKPGKASVVPKHTKDRVRKVWANDTDVFVVLDETGAFLTASGFGDAGDASMLTLGQAHKAVRDFGVGNVVNVSEHPQLAVLFYTNR
jgi:hypothetical protein